MNSTSSQKELQVWALAASFLTPIEIIHIYLLTIGVSVALLLLEALRNKLRNKPGLLPQAYADRNHTNFSANDWR